MKPGSYLVRLDRDKLKSQKASPCVASRKLFRLPFDVFSSPCRLIVSYKFTTAIFHRQLAEIQIKPTVEKKKPTELLCRLEAKHFKLVKTLVTDFLVKLYTFINAMTRNKNWVEKELQQSDLEVQLGFRDFVIFPQRDTILIIRKTRVCPALIPPSSFVPPSSRPRPALVLLPALVPPSSRQPHSLFRRRRRRSTYIRACH